MMRMKASGGISEEATHIDRHKDIAPFEEAMIDRKWKKKGTGAGERLERKGWGSGKPAVKEGRTTPILAWPDLSPFCRLSEKRGESALRKLRPIFVKRCALTVIWFYNRV